MYRGGESSGYYAPPVEPVPVPVSVSNWVAPQAPSNGWYWDGTQYQQESGVAYHAGGGAGPGVGAGGSSEEVRPYSPPDLVAGGNGSEDLPPPPPPPPLTGSSSHEEHYAFYEHARQPPDVLQRGESIVPSSDRNLFMETGHLDDRDELVLGGVSGGVALTGTSSTPLVIPVTDGDRDNGDDRDDRDERNDLRVVTGGTASLGEGLEQRSEAVGADRIEAPTPGAASSLRGDSASPSSPIPPRSVEGNDEEGEDRATLPSVAATGGSQEQREERETMDDEEEEEEEEESDQRHPRRQTDHRSSPKRSSPKKKDARATRPRPRHDSPENERRSNRRRESRRTSSPPSSDEYTRGPSRRNSRRYSSKYAPNHSHNKSYNRGGHNDSYYYDDHASMRSERSYIDDRRRSHHHNRSVYYDYPSRPSSRASNFEAFDYARSSRRHYDPYYASSNPAVYGPPPTAAPMPDPALLESFRRNWEYYSRNPAQMEALRISNPVQHATLLRYYQMYSHLLPAAEPQSSLATSEQQQQNDLRPSSRNSVHSGQSSVADNLTRPSDESPSVVDQDTKIQEADVTPLKFCAPHINGSFGAANGILSLVHAKSPKIGQSASVDLIPLHKKMSEDVPSHTRNLTEFPGPLIPGRTHKGEVIRFCQNKISVAAVRKDIVDKDSYVLLWELLILLLRQKNAIDGSDIAELLLKDSPTHADLNGVDGSEEEEDEIEDEEASNSPGNSSLDREIPEFSTDNQGKVTSRFRDYLLYGHKKEGLEYAMKHGLWGHALFLASKMDERSYSNVMLRFANGIAVNDPIQTLYQQMSGRQPIAMKECAESSWGDWRPHLAMILSNPSQKNGLDHKSIMTLGDTLYEKGYLYASQFCYLMINLELGHYSDGASSKLVLIGADHLTTNFKAFTSNVEAVQCTEIFEYVQKLSQPESGGINSFIFYKYLYTLRLLDFGCTSTALHYLEIIADTLSKRIVEGSPIKCDYLDSKAFMNQVLYLADRLKYLDPKYTTAEGEKSEIGDPEWLIKYRNMVGSIQVDYYAKGAALSSEVATTESNQGVQENNIYREEPQQQQFVQEQVSSPQYTQVEYNGQMYYYDASSGQYYLIQSEQQQAPASNTPAPTSPSEDYSSPKAEATPSFSQPQSSFDSIDAPPMIKLIPESIPTPPFSRSRQASLNEGGGSSIAPAASNPSPICTTVSEENSIHPTPNPPLTAAKKPEQKQENKENKKSSKSSGGGLLGRIFGRIVAPPNQVHLPDDKDGDIVWDENKKRWVDSSADPAEEEATNAPPPSDSDLLLKSSSSSLQTAVHPGPMGGRGGGGGNQYSLRGAKGLRGRVDVFKNSLSAPSLSTMALPPPVEEQPNLMPIEPLAEAPGNTEVEEALSTNNNTNGEEAEGPPPMFYNPSQFTSISSVGKTRRNKYV